MGSSISAGVSAEPALILFVRNRSWDCPQVPFHGFCLRSSLFSRKLKMLAVCYPTLTFLCNLFAASSICWTSGTSKNMLLRCFFIWEWIPLLRTRDKIYLFFVHMDSPSYKLLGMSSYKKTCYIIYMKRVYSYKPVIHSCYCHKRSVSSAILSIFWPLLSCRPASH